jgi:Helix-turn-helix domain
MVEQHAYLDAVFHALADPTRRAMLGQLAERELTIGELATPFSMSFAGASKHIRVLEICAACKRRDLRKPMRGSGVMSASGMKSSTLWNPCCAPKTRRKQRKQKKSKESDGVERWIQGQHKMPTAR